MLFDFDQPLINLAQRIVNHLETKQIATFQTAGAILLSLNFVSLAVQSVVLALVTFALLLGAISINTLTLALITGSLVYFLHHKQKLLKGRLKKKVTGNQTLPQEIRGRHIPRSVLVIFVISLLVFTGSEVLGLNDSNLPRAQSLALLLLYNMAFEVSLLIEYFLCTIGAPPKAHEERAGPKLSLVKT